MNQNEIADLVQLHDFPFDDATPKSVKRWMNKIGPEQFRRLIDVREADVLAQSPDKLHPRIDKCAEMRAVAKEILEEEQKFSLKDLAVNGKDLMAIGIEGRAIGKTLNELFGQVVDGKIPNDHEVLMLRASEIAKGATSLNEAASHNSSSPKEQNESLSAKDICRAFEKCIQNSDEPSLATLKQHISEEKSISVFPIPSKLYEEITKALAENNVPCSVFSDTAQQTEQQSTFVLIVRDVDCEKAKSVLNELSMEKEKVESLDELIDNIDINAQNTPEQPAPETIETERS